MLNSISDRKFRKLARECIDKCNQCKNTPDESHYNEAVSSIRKLLEFYGNHLNKVAENTEVDVCKAERALASTLLALHNNLEKVLTEYNELTQNVTKTTQDKKNHLQQQDQVLSDILTCENQQKEIQGNIDTLTSEKEKSQAQLAELDDKLQKQKTGLEMLKVSKQNLEAEWCGQFNAVAGKMRQNLESVKHLQNVYRHLNDSNNFQLVNNNKTLEYFKKNALLHLTNDNSGLSANLNEWGEKRSVWAAALADKLVNASIVRKNFAPSDVPDIISQFTTAAAKTQISRTMAGYNDTDWNKILVPDYEAFAEWMNSNLPKDMHPQLKADTMALIRKVFEGYVDANNKYNLAKYHLSYQRGQKENVARKLCGTVYSLTNNSDEWQKVIQHSLGKLNAGIDISAYPESVRKQVEKFNSEARTVFDELVGEQKDFHNRIERLKTTLSRFFGSYDVY
ncbi:hypothetical protein NY904_004538 [Escherichia coli]|nr:hypothetical protein [Escherichia coli]